MAAEHANAVSSDIAFTQAVKEIQRQRGSRASYARMEKRGGWATEIDEDLKGFIEDQRSFFFATSNAENQPYIQHRGGPPGFLRVLGPRTLGFADFARDAQRRALEHHAENRNVRP